MRVQKIPQSAYKSYTLRLRARRKGCECFDRDGYLAMFQAKSPQSETILISNLVISHPKSMFANSKKSLDQSEQRAEMFAINQFKSKVNESFDEKFPIRAISSLQIPQPSPPC